MTTLACTLTSKVGPPLTLGHPVFSDHGDFTDRPQKYGLQVESIPYDSHCDWEQADEPRSGWSIRGGSKTSREAKEPGRGGVEEHEPSWEICWPGGDRGRGSSLLFG